ASPLTINVDSHVIPAVKQAQLDHFITELFRVVPRRLLPTRQGRPGGTDSPRTIGERLRMLSALHGNWKAPPPSCSMKPGMASTMKGFGLSLPPPPGAAFLKMSSVNWLRSTSTETPKFRKLKLLPTLLR